MPVKFPVLRKEWSTKLTAWHDLTGVTSHPDAIEPHLHEWTITLIWINEINCKVGFHVDEHAIDASWGARIRELRGKNLSNLMTLPPTAENFACWLLWFWLPRLSDREVTFELDGVRVTKDGHSAEIMHNTANKRGWEWFGGEVA